MTLTEVLWLSDWTCPLTVLEAEHVYCPEAVLATLVNGSTTLVSEMKLKLPFIMCFYPDH